MCDFTRWGILSDEKKKYKLLHFHVNGWADRSTCRRANFILDFSAFNKGSSTSTHRESDSTSARLWSARVAHLDISSFPRAAVNVMRQSKRYAWV